MSVWRILGRMVFAVLCCVVVSGGLLVGAGAAALAVDWRIPEPDEIPGPSTLRDRDGTALYRFRAEIERRPVALARIAPELRDAVVATEDHRFYEHPGVDPLSVIRAVVSNVRTGRVAEGGSTLTQQYVKNVYVGDDRSLYRKVREAVVSVQLEKELSKDEILEQYLNRAYFGDGAYGAEAAALTYFGKNASELTLGESALLASTLSAPSRLSPRADPVQAAQARDAVLDEMLRYGLGDPAAVAGERAVPLVLAPSGQPAPAAPFLVEEARRQLLVHYGPELLYNGGLDISLTVDLDRQFALERSVIPHLPADPLYDIGVAVVDPPTGDIVAAWSGRDFERQQVDLALGGGTVGRQPGSSFKPVVLTTAVEEGMGMDTAYPAPSTLQIADYRLSGGGCGGTCTLREATVSSVNTVYVQLGNDVGVADFTEMARRLGMQAEFADNDLTQALGSAQVTPLDMASAYATLANDGIACPARLVLSAEGPDGAPMASLPDPRQPTPEQRTMWAQRLEDQGYRLPPEELGRCHRAVAPSVARTVTSALEGSVAEGTGQDAQIGRPQAGKTGTSQESKDLWFSGYTPDLSAAVFLGYIPSEIPVRGLPGCRGACFGGDVAAPIWRDVAATLLADVPPRPFPSPVEPDRSRTLSPDRRRLGQQGALPDVGTRVTRPPPAPVLAPVTEP